MGFEQEILAEEGTMRVEREREHNKEEGFRPMHHYEKELIVFKF